MATLPFLGTVTLDFATAFVVLAFIAYEFLGPKVGHETSYSKAMNKLDNGFDRLDKRIGRLEHKQKKSAEVLGTLSRRDDGINEERVYEDLFENGTDPDYYLKDDEEDDDDRPQEDITLKGGVYLTDDHGSNTEKGES